MGEVTIRLWWYFNIFVFCFSSFILFCWIGVSNDYVVFDKSISEYLSFYYRWGYFILNLIILVVLYLVVLLAHTSYQITAKCNYSFKYVNKFLLVFIVALGTIGFSIIIVIWYPELQTVKLFMQMTSPFLSWCAMLFLTLLANVYVVSKSCKSRKKCVIIFVPLFTLFFVAPYYIYSPCMKEDIKNLPKPIILGHKGFPKVAPENTLMSFEEAIQAEADGFEADVAVSMDGIPFLIHDHNLKRTTDVHTVFSRRKDSSPELFTWQELQHLNAGKWFLKSDPYGRVTSLSQSHKQRIRDQKIMSLYQLATLAKHYKKYLIFDLRQPPYPNPHSFNYINIIVDAVLSTGIDQSQVMWISGYNYQHVMSVAPGFKQVYPAKPTSLVLKQKNISMLILEYNTVNENEIQMYSSKDRLLTIVYTSSTQWTFSLAWCQGAYAVISDDPLSHSELTRPIWSYTVKEFQTAWFISLSLCLLLSLCNNMFQNLHRKQF